MYVLLLCGLAKLTPSQRCTIEIVMVRVRSKSKVITVDAVKL